MIDHLVKSSDCVINNNPAGFVLLLERQFADLVVLQHDGRSLTIIPKSTVVLDCILIDQLIYYLIVRGISSMFRVLVGSFSIS